MTTTVSDTLTSNTPKGAPSKEVTVVFPAHGGHQTGMCRLPYTGGRLNTYFRHGLLIAYGLVGFVHRNKALKADGSRVKLSYVPVPGDIIVVKKTTAR